MLVRDVVDELIFVIEKGKLGDYEEALLVAERHGVRAHVSLDIFPHVLARPVLEELDGIPLLSFTTTPSNPVQLVAKRAIDLALSLVLFLVTLPIQLLSAAGDPGHLRPAGLLPADALRPERPPLHAAEVPHDGAGRRGAPFGDLALERDDRPGLQGLRGTRA